MNQASNILAGLFVVRSSAVIVEMISYRQKTVNQASNIRSLVLWKSGIGTPVGMIIETIRHYTVNQASNIRGSAVGVLSFTVGMIIEMIRHWTVNQASNIP